VIAHVVLFRPKPAVAGDARAGFIDAIVAARQSIPSIRRFWVGRRLAGEAPSYRIPTADFPFAAVVEFDDLGGLTAYLTHPSHDALSHTLHATVEAALVFDYEIGDAAEAGRIVGLSGTLGDQATV
jgi:hypothetical protein